MDHDEYRYLGKDLGKTLEKSSEKLGKYFIKLHEDIQGDKTQIFTQEKEWSEETSPWIDLAMVTINRALSFKETEQLSFNLGRQPDSLGVVEGFTAHDPNSINAARVRIYGLSLAIRSLIYKRNGKFKKI